MSIKIDPEKSGTFIVSYSKRDPITRLPYTLKRKGFKSKAEAKRAYDQMVLDAEHRIRAKRIPTWAKAVEGFLESCENRGLTKKTIEDYGLALRAHTYEPWEKKFVDGISTNEIRELVIARSCGSVSKQKSLLKFIRGVFSFACDGGYINRNPCPDMRFKIPHKIKPVLTWQQAKTLLNRAREMRCEWYPHWAMALYTGMRNGELYALTWDKVNFENGQIRVDCSYSPQDGLKSTKSGDDRMIDVSPTLLTLLKQWKLDRSDSVFVLPRSDQWDNGEQARELRMFMMGIGIEPIRFHDLRATWATMMLGRGVEPIKVMAMGGWRDLKTMMIYARKAGVDIKGISNCLTDLHDPSEPSAKVLKMAGRSDLSLLED